jgi:Uma2 family endonuclease
MRTMEPAVWYNPDLTQIINGEEIMSPSPFLPHQKVSMKLLTVLQNHIGPDDLGELFHAPLDVIFEDGFNVLQPDVFFVSRQNDHILKDWVRGVPDLVIEIVSKSSVKMDTVVKKEIYERYGVQECWIVYPEKAAIEIFSLVSRQYVLSGIYKEDQQVHSPLLKDLRFQASRIF